MGLTSKGRTYRGRNTRKVQIKRKRMGIPKETLDNTSFFLSSHGLLSAGPDWTWKVWSGVSEIQKTKNGHLRTGLNV